MGKLPPPLNDASRSGVYRATDAAEIVRAANEAIGKGEARIGERLKKKAREYAAALNVA